MTTRAEEFAGLSVALTTPFRDGEVDYETLQAQVEFQVEAGTTSVCPVGTTGESPTLSHEEHERVIQAVVEAASGRIKVMAGTGSNSTQEALRFTRWAAEKGWRPGANGRLNPAPSLRAHRACAGVPPLHPPAPQAGPTAPLTRVERAPGALARGCRARRPAGVRNGPLSGPVGAAGW